MGNDETVTIWDNRIIDAEKTVDGVLRTIDSIMLDMKYLYDRTSDRGTVTLDGFFYRDIYSAMEKLRSMVRVAYK